jgi:hypothetical protein
VLTAFGGAVISVKVVPFHSKILVGELKVPL